MNNQSEKFYQYLLGAIVLGLLVVAAVYIVGMSREPKVVSFTKPSENKPRPQTTTIFMAGDIMLSRNVAAKMYAANNFSLPFEKVYEKIAAADISLANLESPFNNTGDHSVEGSLVFNADPAAVAGLTKAGFDVLSTANNHSFDQGQTGINFTLTHLKQNGIIPVGTTDSTFDLSQNVIKKNDILFGFLAYSYTAKNNGGKIPDPHVADANNLAQVKQDIRDMKGHFADVVIVNLHAGTEYVRNPTADQIAFAHAAIDAGADLVIGHHPHWVQTVEQYQGKWIIYSLGNFVFDQMWSQDTREGLTATITFDRQELKKIELAPIVIDNFCCPRWANDTEAKSILQKINLQSKILFENSK